MNSQKKSPSLFQTFFSFIFLLLILLKVQAQTEPAVYGEMAISKIVMNNKNYVSKPNQIGYFKPVWNVQPFSTVLVEIVYPDAKAGEKVILSVEDGGSLDNKSLVKGMELNAQKEISFNFQPGSEPGIYRITLRKGNDVKVVPLWVSNKINEADKSLLGAEATAGTKCGNGNECGKTDGKCKQCSEEGDAGANKFNPFNGNASRTIRDLEIWGGVGGTQLTWNRYGNSRPGQLKDNFGTGHHWNGSYMYDMFDDGENEQGQPQITIHFPEGGSYTFVQDITNPDTWLPPPAIGMRLFQNGNDYTLQMADGYRYRFEKLTDESNATYYQLQGFLDPSQNLYQLSYDDKKKLAQITEPAGRFLQIIYKSFSGIKVIDSVKTSDGRYVKYNYRLVNDSIENWVILDTVFYGDETKAIYRYSQNQPGTRPALAQATDPRCAENTTQMKYRYDRNVTGFIKEEYNGVTNQVMATLDASSEDRRVCYPNGRIQIFNQPNNSYGLTNSYSDGLGRTTVYEYYNDGIGFLKSKTDALGRTTTYNAKTIYDNPLKITYPDQSMEKWVRDDLDLITVHVDELGRITKYIRDEKHRIIRTEYADKSFETFAYNDFGQVVYHQRRNGGIEQSEYDSSGLLISFSDAAGNVTKYTYYPSGKMKSITDARGFTTSYEYNERGLMTKVTNPDSTYKTYAYDNFGNRTTSTDELNHTWATAYDEFRRPVSVTDPLGRTKMFSYDLPKGVCGCAHAENNPTKMTLPSGRITENEYDVEWQKIRQTVGAGSEDAATTFYEYNLTGKLETVIDPNGNEWTYEYDLRDRKKSESDPLSNKMQWVYDAVGNMKNVLRPDGGTTVNEYDEMNRLISTTDAKQQITKMAYDKEGNMNRLADPKNNVYQFKFDLLNRQIKMTYPDGSAELNKYDPVGNLIGYSNRAGNTRKYFYDNRNREIRSVWDDGVTPSIARSYDEAGRVDTIFTSVSQLTYTYNNANELTGETQNVKGNGPGKKVNFAYNDDGLLDQMVYPSGSTLSYKYTARNQVDSIAVNGGPPLAIYTYDLNGNRLSKTLENKTSTLYVYDDANRLLRLDNRKDSISFGLFEYGYNNVNNRTYVKRDKGKGDAYYYDSIDQVSKVLYEATNPDTNPINPERTVEYHYDPAGNRITLTDDDAVTDYSTNNLNQYTKVGDSLLTSDTNGNLKKFNGWTYTYDAQNRLILATNKDTTVAFAYDPKNRCVQRKVNGNPIFFYYDDWNLIEERDAANKPVTNYIHGVQVDEIIKKISKSMPDIYYHYDALGSTVKLTNKNGNVVEQYSYDVFGTPTIRDQNGNFVSESTFSNRFIFTGREYISAIKLYNYRTRMYSDSLGRFLETDPLRFDAEDYNLYRYSFNTPINKTDPLGMKCDPWGAGDLKKNEDRKIKKYKESKIVDGWLVVTYDEYLLRSYQVTYTRHCTCPDRDETRTLNKIEEIFLREYNESMLGNK